MHQTWQLKTTDPAAAKSIQKYLGCHFVTASLLAQKDLTSKSALQRFLRPTLHHLRPPFSLVDMQPAVERISRAIDMQEKILIFGDYDVDGVTATTLISHFLIAVGANVQTYIPHRLTEGYGLKVDHITNLAIRGHVALVVTVDCGISSHDAVSLAQANHIDVIVTDHHDPPSVLPEAVAVVNPKREDCVSDLTHLSGVGIVFYLAMALRMHLRAKGLFKQIPEPNLRKYCDLVALGTVADMVPLVAENRILTVNGLNLMRSMPRPGLKALARTGGIDYRHLDIEDIAFRLGPRINAAGRMDRADWAARLLVAKTRESAEAYADKLNYFNKLRQDTERDVLNDVLARIEKQPALIQGSCLVFAAPNWHSGVVGIVAARLVRRFHKPTVIVSIEDDLGTGSARSIPGVDIRSALDACSRHLLGYGGHPMAAGLQIAASEIESFHARLAQAILASSTGRNTAPVLAIDLTLELADITPELLDEIAAIGPFGNQNPEPVFLAHNVSVRQTAIVGGCHRRMLLCPAGKIHPNFTAIEFNVDPSARQPVHFSKIAYHLQWNRWNGNQSLQLVLKDFQ